MSFRLIDNSDKVKSAMSQQIAAALEAVGLFVEGEAKEELENPPRRVDTGRLKNSITHQVESGEKAVYIGTDVSYSVFVHEGTVRMAPNRFLKNAVARNEGQIRKYIEDNIKR